MSGNGGIDVSALFGSQKAPEPAAPNGTQAAEAQAMPAMQAMPAATAAPAPAARPAAAHSSSGMDEVDFGDKASALPISQHKGAEGRTDRLGLITRKIFAVKTHYDEEFRGRIFCLADVPNSGGVCCKRFGPPDLRYVIPMVLYLPDGTLEVKFLKIDREKYEPFYAMKQNGMDPTLYDYSLTCSDAKFQKIQLTAIGPAQWRQVPEVEKAVIDRFLFVGEFLRQAVARDVTVEQFLAKHGSAPVVQQSAAGFRLGDVI